MSDDNSFCVETKAGLIQVLARAAVESRNGSGVNPIVLVETSLPVVGTTWSAQVDGSQQQWSGLSYLVGYEGQSEGVFTSFGELLVDVSSESVLFNLGVFIGSVAGHDLEVPDDVALIGFSFTAQALVNSSRVLTNGLDLVLGL